MRGIAPWGPWVSSRLDYRLQSDIDRWLNTGAGDRVVRSMPDLEAALTTAVPLRIVWIHEDLEALTRTVWETRKKT